MRGIRFFVEAFLGFTHQPVVAKLSIAAVHFANAIFESLDFLVYVDEPVCVSLIFHYDLPLPRFYSSERMSGERAPGTSANSSFELDELPQLVPRACPELAEGFAHLLG